MVGLDGARVVIVDDNAEEALPVLRALSSRQIPALWFSGQLPELPPPGRPLEHIRLALLDVDLVGARTSNRQKLAYLVRVVQRLLPTESPGLGIVLWTRHAELETEFLDLLVAQGGPIPTFSATFEKANFEVGGRFDWDSLSRELQTVLETTFPWPFLLQWEGASRAATGDVVTELVRIVQKTQGNPRNADGIPAWQSTITTHLSTLLLELAAAELGRENVEIGENVAYGAITAMNPLLEDYLESRIRDQLEMLGAAGARIRDVGYERTLPRGTSATVNTRIALSKPTSRRPWSGNIYVVGSRGGVRPALKHTFDPITFSEVFVSSLAKRKDDLALLAEIKDACLAQILVDVNPACDHAQRKTVCGRLIAGVQMKRSVYKNDRKVKSRPDYIWEYGPVRDEITEEEYYFVLDLRRLISCDSGVLAAVHPWGRLRAAVMLDLQSRLAGHGSRAGTLCVAAKEE